MASKFFTSAKSFSIFIFVHFSGIKKSDLLFRSVMNDIEQISLLDELKGGASDGNLIETLKMEHLLGVAVYKLFAFIQDVACDDVEFAAQEQFPLCERGTKHCCVDPDRKAHDSQKDES